MLPVICQNVAQLRCFSAGNDSSASFVKIITFFKTFVRKGILNLLFHLLKHPTQGEPYVGLYQEGKDPPVTVRLPSQVTIYNT